MATSRAFSLSSRAAAALEAASAARAASLSAASLASSSSRRCSRAALDACSCSCAAATASAFTCAPNQASSDRRLILSAPSKPISTDHLAQRLTTLTSFQLYQSGSSRYAESKQCVPAEGSVQAPQTAKMHLRCGSSAGMVCGAFMPLALLSSQACAQLRQLPLLLRQRLGLSLQQASHQSGIGMP